MWHVAGRKWACSPFTVPMTFRHEPVERTEAASRKATKSGTVQKTMPTPCEPSMDYLITCTSTIHIQKIYFFI